MYIYIDIPRKPSCRKKRGTNESGSFGRHFHKSGSFSKSRNLPSQSFPLQSHTFHLFSSLVGIWSSPALYHCVVLRTRMWSKNNFSSTTASQLKLYPSSYHTLATAILYRCSVFTCTVFDATCLLIWASLPTKSSSIWQLNANGDNDSTPSCLSRISSNRTSDSIWYLGWNLNRVSFKTLKLYPAAFLKFASKSRKESITTSRSSLVSQSEAL